MAKKTSTLRLAKLNPLVLNPDNLNLYTSGWAVDQGNLQGLDLFTTPHKYQNFQAFLLYSMLKAISSKGNCSYLILFICGKLCARY